jgi:hypothetical protein
MEMTNYVKRIMEEDVHTCMSDTHTTYTTRNEKKMNKNWKTRGSSRVTELFTMVTHQCINLVAAGTEIITVRVLKSILVV